MMTFNIDKTNNNNPYLQNLDYVPANFMDDGIQIGQTVNVEGHGIGIVVNIQNHFGGYTMVEYNNRNTNLVVSVLFQHQTVPMDLDVNAWYFETQTGGFVPWNAIHR